MTTITQLGQNARLAAHQLARLSSTAKKQSLHAVSAALLAHTDDILAANARDLATAADHGISGVMLDRLRLDAARIQAIAAGVAQVADLPDPIGTVLRGYTNADGLEILQKRVPLGVIAMIFESRPNVAVDAFSLAFKTGNAIILRGGAQLIRSVKEKARVPVIETGVGNVHIYVDESADLDMATRIVVNAKTQRPSVCNAAENLLVHSAVAPRFLPQLAVAMAAVHAVEYRADERAQPLLPNAVAATEADYTTEFLDYILAVKVVDSATEAIDWINRYTSHHSEAIITRDIARARAFQDAVDAAVVYVNASTRFTDGFVFGLGAEIGISTQKMHTRGPMGLEALTSTKYYVCGEGQIRE